MRDTIKADRDGIVRDVLQDELGKLDSNRAQPEWKRALNGSKSAKYEKGQDFASVVRCLALGEGDPNRAEDWAAKFYGRGSTVAKALAGGDATAGGFLVPSDLAEEVIELLRPLSAVRMMNPRTVRMDRGTKDMPLISSSVSAAYVGENAEISVSEAAFGQKTLSARKLAALTPLSRDLLLYSGDADQVVRQDMVEELAKTEDANLLRGDGTAGAPRGLRFLAASSNVTATNGTSSTNIESDFTDLLEDLEGNNHTLRRPFWVMSSRSKNHLLNLRDSNGNIIFQELRQDPPLIYSIPVIVSNSIPNTLGGGSATELYLTDADEVLLGEVEGVEVEVSREGSYTDSGGTLRSAFSRDQILVRAVLRHDIQLRHDTGSATKTNITWGS